MCQTVGPSGSIQESLLALDFHDPNTQVSDCDLVIGIVTKQTLQELFDEGAISENQRKRFYQAVREILVCATKYLLKWCPFKDELLSHVIWVGFESRLEKTFSSVEYIVHRYLFPRLDMDKLNEQFLSYQLLVEEDIPTSAKESAGLEAEDPYHVDVFGLTSKMSRSQAHENANLTYCSKFPRP